MATLHVSYRTGDLDTLRLYSEIWQECRTVMDIIQPCDGIIPVDIDLLSHFILRCS